MANAVKTQSLDGLNLVNAGTPGSGVTALEYGDGYTHTTVLTINSTLPAIAGGAALGIGKLIYTLPAGAVIVNSSYFSVGITQTGGNINADTPTVGLGTTVASGAVSVLSGTAAFQNISTGKAAANCTGTQTVQTALATSSPFALVIPASGGANHTVYFNVAATWTAGGDAAALLTGTVVLNWQFMA